MSPGLAQLKKLLGLDEEDPQISVSGVSVRPISEAGADRSARMEGRDAGDRIAQEEWRNRDLPAPKMHLDPGMDDEPMMGDDADVVAENKRTRERNRRPPEMNVSVGTPRITGRVGMGDVKLREYEQDHPSKPGDLQDPALRDMVKGTGDRISSLMAVKGAPDPEVPAPAGRSPLPARMAEQMMLGAAKPQDDDLTLLKQAQAEAKARRAAATLSHAGAQFVGRGKEDQANYDRMTAEADRPAHDLGEQMALSKSKREQGRQDTSDSMNKELFGFQKSKLGEDLATEDPTSQESKSRRATIIAEIPALAGAFKPDEWMNLSAKDADAAIKLYNEQRKMGIDERKAARAAAHGGGRAEGAADRQDVKRADALGKETSKGMYGEFHKAFDELERLAPGIKNGSPPPSGVFGTKDRMLNALPGGMGERGMSQGGLAFAKAHQEILDVLERMRSGAVINDKELAHYQKLAGSLTGSDPRSMALGMKQIYGDLHQRLVNLQAPGSEKTPGATGLSPLETLEKHGATSYRTMDPGAGASPGPDWVHGKFKDGRMGWKNPKTGESKYD